MPRLFKVRGLAVAPGGGTGCAHERDASALFVPPSETPVTPMKSAVLVFPGINRERDMAIALRRSGAEPRMIWHRETDLSGLDLIVIPGGFSHGDHLRCGAMAAHPPVMTAVREHAARGGYLLGVCNGFQILTEAGLLPGALLRNASLRFLSMECHLRVERSDTAFTRGYNAGQVIRVPVAHGEGNYEADEETVEAARGRGAGALSATARRTARSTRTPTSTARRMSIAGIVNERGNVLGMMPHPENHVEDIMGCTDGRGLFAGPCRASGNARREILLPRMDAWPRWRALSLAAAAYAQDYPETSDHHDRAVRGRRHLRRDRARGGRADERQSLGQPIVIENVAGAGGSTALARAARADA